ncbi:hypothetical protein QTA56_09370 [Acinetobacter sp. VNH17]|uniref:Lysozyme inhibitor LprI-like N-terminal domain-containing protein n=1 Tax=Acinetobacter thutiue TaxID=2998078 RepID=A0ABT7WP29_9GAMM|nr:lysozyme inhibitor LprI family protein [Acinetobacter thutiue]MCY6412339.1 hypothetical protein [Acinetobacter thutiue]MDN0014443.1 hypothetical protein [Acinetobacter thutiue]
MVRLSVKILGLALAIYTTAVQAASQEAPDPYNQCVDETIQQLNIGHINNAVVEICSNKTKTLYAKQIVKLLDQIKNQSKDDQQPERYSDIMKSQQLWKNFVDQECRNAGAYIGSPMYEFCPMQKYAERVEQLGEYLN